jgi:hypothetical protein
MTPTRALIGFAAWFTVSMSWAVVWAFAVGRMPPWWLTVAVGVGVFAAVEICGRARVRRRERPRLRVRRGFGSPR